MITNLFAIKDKDTHIIDTRKPFEYEVGTFKKSVNPNVNNFKDFPKYLNKLKKNKYFLKKFLTSNNIRGTIIIAKEGLNGTISGRVKDIDKTTKKLKSLFSFKQFDNSNESKSKFQPFHKPKVKIKKEVVPMNLILDSRERNIKSHLDPKEWNKLIKDKENYQSLHL